MKGAEGFKEQIGFDGVIVTKLDGDARGGAALSVCLVTGQPIYFIGSGETIEALKPLHPERMASRILGMGDVLTLVEKAQQAVDVKDAEKIASRVRKNEFTLDDFVEQMQMVHSILIHSG